MIEVKVVIVGDRSVGKTSLLMSYFQRKYQYHNQVPPLTSQVTEVDQQEVQLNFWDSKGEDDWAKKHSSVFRKVDLFLIVFSLADEFSFRNATQKWFGLVRSFCSEAFIVFVGNKADLREKGSLTTEEIRIKMEELGCPFVECSALMRKGIPELFKKIAEEGVANKRTEVKGQNCCRVM